jgi:hypothetical protein
VDGNWHYNGNFFGVYSSSVDQSGDGKGETKMSSGIKHDQEKPDMSLLSSIAIVKMAQVMTYGKKKYSAHNWRGGLAFSRLLAAALRHIFAYLGGEDKDPETGLSHLAHASCCLMMLLEQESTRPDLDDRYKREIEK